MTTTTATTDTPAPADNRTKKDQPFWAVPTVLAIILLSSGGFVLLLAQALKVLSSIQ